ncbi:MAG: response regulator [Ktedonobacterales bacterium]
MGFLPGGLFVAALGDAGEHPDSQYTLLDLRCALALSFGLYAGDGERWKGAYLDATPTSVLLIDDNADLLDLLSRAIRYLGQFNVLRAKDGESGLELAVATHPACIVVDIVMSGLDGYQLVRALRGDPDTADIPVVMLTALAQDRNRLAGFLSGADRYLVKPVKPQDLVVVIQQAIASSGEERTSRLRALVDKDEAGTA